MRAAILIEGQLALDLFDLEQPAAAVRAKPGGKKPDHLAHDLSDLAEERDLGDLDHALPAPKCSCPSPLIDSRDEIVTCLYCGREVAI